MCIVYIGQNNAPVQSLHSGVCNVYVCLHTVNWRYWLSEEKKEKKNVRQWWHISDNTPIQSVLLLCFVTGNKVCLFYRSQLSCFLTLHFTIVSDFSCGKCRMSTIFQHFRWALRVKKIPDWIISISMNGLEKCLFQLIKKKKNNNMWANQSCIYKWDSIPISGGNIKLLSTTAFVWSRLLHCLKSIWYQCLTSQSDVFINFCIHLTYASFIQIECIGCTYTVMLYVLTEKLFDDDDDVVCPSVGDG